MYRPPDSDLRHVIYSLVNKCRDSCIDVSGTAYSPCSGSGFRCFYCCRDLLYYNRQFRAESASPQVQSPPGTPSAEQHDHISFNYINNTATLMPLGGLLITFNFFAVSSATFPLLGWRVQKCAYTGEHPRGHEKPSYSCYMFCAGSTFLNAGLPHSHCEFRGILVLSPLFMPQRKCR